MDFEYSIIDGAVHITAYKGRSENLCIPDYIEGKKVAVIGKNAFNGNRHIKKLSMVKMCRLLKITPFFTARSCASLSLTPNSR